MNRSIVILLITCLGLSTACISNKKTLILQNGGFKKDLPTAIVNEVPVYRLQANDVISIRIKTLDQENAEYLSLQPDGIMNITPIATFLNGYSINDSGYIHMPSVGKVEVAGLSVSEAQSKIQNLIRTSALRDASVFVTLVSFKISVIGEVSKPGYYYIYNNQVNILEALAMAGDAKEFADREHINLIRQNTNGSDVVLLDLKDASIMSSPYYYLQPSDVIYVPGLEEKNQRSNLSALVIINAMVSTVTATVAILNLIERQRAANQE